MKSFSSLTPQHTQRRRHCLHKTKSTPCSLVAGSAVVRMDNVTLTMSLNSDGTIDECINLETATTDDSYDSLCCDGDVRDSEGVLTDCADDQLVLDKGTDQVGQQTYVESRGGMGQVGEQTLHDEAGPGDGDVAPSTSLRHGRCHILAMRARTTLLGLLPRQAKTTKIVC